MRRRAGLVVRIYLIVLAQFCALGLTFALLRAAGGDSVAFLEEQSRFLIEEVTSRARDKAALESRLRELHQRTGLTVELRDREGRIVAATGPMRYHGPGTFAMNWSGGTAAVLAPAPAGGPFWGIAVMLLITAISALLMTRWLARPLAVLSATARALGAGQLSARANLRRNDELGDVAAAFDEMAERIENLVHGQRELLANVSHELRTPIARIHVALDLAAEGSAQDVADSLPGIAGDLSELERLTSDILTSARLELSSSVPPLRVEPTAARQLIEDASTRFRDHHPASQLRIDDRSGETAVDVDRMLLRRALDNLLDNAAKYSEAGGEVVLSAEASEERLIIEIRDRGQGIAPEDMRSLFKPFFRADRSRARQTGGLGLGLLLARRIVEAHHGSLEIESELGVGTVARVRVPIAS